MVRPKLQLTEAERQERRLQQQRKADKKRREKNRNNPVQMAKRAASSKKCRDNANKEGRSIRTQITAPRETVSVREKLKFANKVIDHQDGMNKTQQMLVGMVAGCKAGSEEPEDSEVYETESDAVDEEDDATSVADDDSEVQEEQWDDDNDYDDDDDVPPLVEARRQCASYHLQRDPPVVEIRACCDQSLTLQVSKLFENRLEDNGMDAKGFGLKLKQLREDKPRTHSRLSGRTKASLNNLNAERVAVVHHTGVNQLADGHRFVADAESAYPALDKALDGPGTHLAVHHVDAMKENYRLRANNDELWNENGRLRDELEEEQDTSDDLRKELKAEQVHNDQLQADLEAEKANSDILNRHCRQAEDENARLRAELEAEKRRNRNRKRSVVTGSWNNGDDRPQKRHCR